MHRLLQSDRPLLVNYGFDFADHVQLLSLNDSLYVARGSLNVVRCTFFVDRCALLFCVALTYHVSRTTRLKVLLRL